MADALKKVQTVAPPSKGKIQLYSKEYFAACTLGGIIGTFFFTQIMTQFNDLIRIQHVVQHIPWSLLSIS